METHLRRTDREEPVVVRHTVTLLGNHPSSQGDVAACWETVPVRAFVQVVAGRRGDVVSACLGGAAFEACGVPVHDGLAVRRLC